MFVRFYFESYNFLALTHELLCFAEFHSLSFGATIEVNYLKQNLEKRW